MGCIGLSPVVLNVLTANASGFTVRFRFCSQTRRVFVLLLFCFSSKRENLELIRNDTSCLNVFGCDVSLYPSPALFTKHSLLQDTGH